MARLQLQQATRLFSTSALRLQEASNSSRKGWGTRSSAPSTKRSAPKTDAISQSIQHLSAARSKGQEEQEIHNAFVRKFGMGSTYDPFDFSLTKLKLDREAQQTAPKYDRFKKTQFDPVKLWKDPVALSEFITPNGKIIPGYKNGHRKATQKKIARAIRRARAAGLLSPVHQDVSLLPAESKSR